MPNARESLTRQKILVGVCSCRTYKHKRDAVRNTWMMLEPTDTEVVFFVGGSTPMTDEPDTVSLDASDLYDYLPQKVRAFFKYALAHHEFDWLFKCDDDTYVELHRLHSLADGTHEFVGNAEFLRRSGYASGGAGYLLSRKLVTTLAGADHLPKTGAEDMIITKEALRGGIRFLGTDDLCWDQSRYPRRNNTVVTSHWCSPERLRVIHSALHSKPLHSFAVSHIHWKDHIDLFETGIFSRRSGSCCGNWEIDEKGTLHLKWFGWKPESVEPCDKGYRSDKMTLVPTVP